MTISVHLVIQQDGETLVEDAVEYSEDQDGLWLATLDWLVRRGQMARSVFFGPPPSPAPPLPREAWDKDFQGGKK